MKYRTVPEERRESFAIVHFCFDDGPARAVAFR